MSTGQTRLGPRRRPSQARAQQTVDHLLEGAARVFRREGWSATTNRIAEAAGVGIGTLYEYFPNKEALLLALAERHVAEAEREIDAALARESETEELVRALSLAIRKSQRYPSHALELVRDVPRIGPALQARAEALRSRILDRLTRHARAARLDDPELRARAAFGALGELTARAMYTDPETHEALAGHLCAMAAHVLGG